MILQKTVNGMMAGLMIIIGCCVYLACENAYVGAVLFAVALLSICFKGYALFTGKVGYLVESHTAEDWRVVLLGLLGNLIATWILGTLARIALPHLGEKALAICTGKLTQTAVQTFIRAFFCGVLMYMAVSIYRDNKSLSGIFFCVPVFILSGFEHSIANMGYFAMSGIVSFEAFVFIWIAIFGNALGGMILPLMKRVGAAQETF